MPGSLPGSPSSHATHGRHGLSRALSSSTPVFLSSASFHLHTPSGAASVPPPHRDQRDILSPVESLSSPSEGKWQEGSQASEEVNLMAQRWPTAQEASPNTARGRGHRTRQQGGQEAASGLRTSSGTRRSSSCTGASSDLLCDLQPVTHPRWTSSEI